MVGFGLRMCKCERKEQRERKPDGKVQFRKTQQTTKLLMDRSSKKLRSNVLDYHLS